MTTQTSGTNSDNHVDLFYVIYFNEVRQERESAIVEACSASEAGFDFEQRGDTVLEVYAYSNQWGIIGYDN